MRRKSIFLVILAIIVIALSGCNKYGPEKIVAQLKESGTGDSGKKFEIEYAFWYNPNSKNIFSTYANYIQKDLISAGSEKRDWNISDEDLIRLEQIVRKYEVYKIDKKINAIEYSSDDQNAITIPMQEFYIRFNIDGKEYLLEGNWSIYDVVDSSEEAKEICVFLDELRNIMFEQEVYYNMPEPEGAYE